MKYLKSSNWIYMAITLPLLTADGIFAMLVARRHPAIQVIILGILVFAIVKIIGKFSHMPFKKTAYAELVKTDLDIPLDWSVEICTSAKMAEYDFMTRIVEIVSPMKMGQKTVVAINPAVLEKEGKTYMRIAITREVLRYAYRISAKLYALISLPIMLFIGVILFFFSFHQVLTSYFSLAALNLLLPFVLMLLFLLSLFFWNNRVAYYDTLLDKMLLDYFPKQAVIDYIKHTEVMMSKGDKEKSKVFNEHFLSSRVRKIEEFRKNKDFE